MEELWEPPLMAFPEVEFGQFIQMSSRRVTCVPFTLKVPISNNGENTEESNEHLKVHSKKEAQPLDINNKSNEGSS
jgi:hypothetical protein